MPSGKEITWNGVSSSLVPALVVGKVTRQLLGAFRGKAMDIPGRPGGWFFGQPRGYRRITVECFVETATIAERRDAVTAVADWVDIENEAQLTISDEPNVFYLAHLAEPPDVNEWREAGIFDLEWVCQPYSFDLLATIEEWSSGIDTDHTWNPNLTVPVYPVIEVRPTNGTLTGFTLEGNGYTLGFTGSITSGATVTVNCISATVTSGVNTDSELTGSYIPANTIMSGVSGDFPILLPGITNNIHFIKLSGTATTINVKVTFRKSYRR